MTQRETFTKKCKGCDKNWNGKAFKCELKKRLFCSKDCANKSNAEKNSLSKQGIKNPMYGRVPYNKCVYGKQKHPSHSKEKNHFWKGGISREKYKIRRSPQWKAWRLDVFRRDKYTCKRCGVVGGSLVPHHIKLFSYFPKERFLLNNGVTICVPCHRILHRKENQSKTVIKYND